MVNGRKKKRNDCRLYILLALRQWLAFKKASKCLLFSNNKRYILQFWIYGSGNIEKVNETQKLNIYFQLIYSLNRIAINFNRSERLLKSNKTV